MCVANITKHFEWKRLHIANNTNVLNGKKVLNVANITKVLNERECLSQTLHRF